ncbi:MAG TPA: M20/M25/M40 family metallo-hydrolase [Gemmatimonadales bacterium]|jgi:hypothetical protein
MPLSDCKSVVRLFGSCLLLGLFPGVIPAQTAADTTAIRRILVEGREYSHVMETARWLTDIYGPRLTGSPLDSAAGIWAMNQMREWGLANVHAEPFAFDRPSWLNEKFYMQVTSPASYPVLAMASAWSVGTNGLVTAPVVIARIRSAADTVRLQGTLAGKVALISAPFIGTALAPAPAVHLSEATLDEMVARKKDWYLLGHDSYIEINEHRPEPPVVGPGLSAADAQKFLNRQGVVAVLRSFDGVGGNFAVDGTDPQPIPMVDVAPEHYSRMYRTLEGGTPVIMEFDIRNRVGADSAKPVNVIAELPGTDRRNEVVMIGAHLDSWAGGTGATDNAAGVAVMMEAMRILKASGVPLRRTVRIGLWNGEEQGSVGSTEYTRAHLGSVRWQRDPATHKNTLVATLLPEAARFSAYFNLDQGAGTIRGIDRYTDVAAEPTLQAWVRLLHSDSLQVTHVTAIGNDPSDDAIFDDLGLPTFYFVQDPLDYTRGTHHTSQDLYDRLDPEVMRHNAVAVAAIVYLAANRDSLMPRGIRQ